MTEPRSVLDLILLMRGCDLTATQRLLLIAIATRASGEAGYCSAAYPTLAEDTGLGARTIERELPKLVSLGVLLAERRRGETTVYRVRGDAIPNPRHGGGSERPFTSAMVAAPSAMVAAPSAMVAAPPAMVADDQSIRSLSTRQTSVSPPVGGSGEGRTEPLVLSAEEEKPRPTRKPRAPSPKKPTKPGPGIEATLRPFGDAWSAAWALCRAGERYPWVIPGPDAYALRGAAAATGWAIGSEPGPEHIEPFKRAAERFITASFRGDVFGCPVPSIAAFSRQLARWLLDDGAVRRSSHATRGLSSHQTAEPDLSNPEALAEYERLMMQLEGGRP